MSAVERVRELVQPLATRKGAEIYDVEHESGILRILLDKPEGGIDVDLIGELSTEISTMLDDEDPIPENRYLLEVTSPGVERKLRTPEHFAKQVGEPVAVKVKRTVEGERRFDAVIKSVSDDSVELEVKGESRQLPYEDIDTAKLIYDWSKDFSKITREDKLEKQKQDNSISNKKASAS